MNKFIYTLLIAFCFASCSEYQKALKSDDIAVKAKTASDLYENGKYSKAIMLYEQIAPAMRGKPNAERIFYQYAMSNYNLAKKVSAYYVAASFQLESFAANYPSSEKREEALFLSAECMYKMSPRYSLDQNDTYKALDKLQQFIDLNPKSQYLPQANEYVKNLREKLEKKAFENAKQFNTIAEWARDFKAPINALDNFLADYPGTPYKEDALYYKFEAMYKYAINSIEAKKQERLLNAKTAYESLIKFNKDTKFKDEADKMIETVEKELTQYSN